MSLTSPKLPISEQEFRKTTLEAWASATSYSALIELNEDFLQRNVWACSPYHYGPFDFETETRIKKLLELHSYDLLIIGSQPSSKLYTHQAPQPSQRSEWQECQQRTFLNFLLPRKTHKENSRAKKICRALQSRQDLSTFIIDHRQKTKKSQSDVVTRYRSAETLEKLEYSDWKKEAAALGEDGWPDWGIDILKDARPLEIYVAARSWDVGFDLLSIVKELLQSVHQAPVT